MFRTSSLNPYSIYVCRILVRTEFYGKICLILQKYFQNYLNLKVKTQRTNLKTVWKEWTKMKEQTFPGLASLSGANECFANRAIEKGNISFSCNQPCFLFWAKNYIFCILVNCTVVPGTAGQLLDTKINMTRFSKKIDPIW